jgi:hypothetical protein
MGGVSEAPESAPTPDASTTEQALAELETRLSREVTALRKILSADLPVHVRRSARIVFERSARELDDAALAALKAGAEELALSLPGQVLEPFAELEAWAWPEGEPFPERPTSLRDHPRVAGALEACRIGLERFLSEHGFPAAEVRPHVTYSEPAYFVGGLYLKSVVANYWRALSDYDALSREVRELASAETRAARRQRWEEAP